MIFTSLTIPGSFLIDLDKKSDERGFLARSFDKNEFVAHKIDPNFVQGYTCSSLSYGTLRGLHYQIPPHKVSKLTRVIRGVLFEVILDLRPNSPTYKKWFGIKIKAGDYKMMITPPGCAHAVLTLSDNTEYIAYYTAFYNQEFERGIRYNDPAFRIKWPVKIEHISAKDKAWPRFKG